MVFMRQVENNQNNHNSDLLLEVKDFYNNIVDDTVELMNLYNCKTPIEVYCLFNMINNYYVKEDEIFKLLYMKDSPIYSKKLEENEIMGIQTLLNGGVCRHRSAMLNDIYRKMGLDSIFLLGRLETHLEFYYGNSKNKQIADRAYVQKVLKRITEGAKIDDFKSNLRKRKISYHFPEVHDDYFYKNMKWPNHAIVMVGEDKRYYLDPTINITYYKDDRDVSTLRNRSGYYFFSYRNLDTLHYWEDKNQELVKIVDRILQLPGANESETTRNIKEIYSYLRQFKNGIEEFVRSKSSSIEEIRTKCLTLSTK